MVSEDLGYTEYPKNNHGIKRARTTQLIRSWDILRSMESLKALTVEMGSADFPGLYLLFEGMRVYVGEAKSVLKRLETHSRAPEKKISGWQRAVVINDGRPASQSDFNDGVVRKALELYLINLFKTNKYEVVAQGEGQTLNPAQRHMVGLLKTELLFFFRKKNLIDKDVEREEEREVFSDEVQKILSDNDMRIDHWKEKQSIIDGEVVFIRQGSKKPKGYQITIRGRKPGSFIDCFKRGVGNLLVRRDGVLFIPLRAVQDVIDDVSAYEQDTIDIYITFSEDKALLHYKDNTIDVTGYKLVK